MFVLTIFVLIAEAGQLFIPYRSFDWLDVIWGSMGSLFGLVIPITRTIILEQFDIDI
ncbi:hypothetical protein [Adhaeribacter radiodurans]|uniref:VanZ family protein n=1 Tax=Adhaeribacter radiodurans TaxID=2745197 RepID=A0A7L7L3Q8_9BACT|nr:hypothetical protein HUW48_05015 [Adhaeribacter radiodurans]